MENPGAFWGALLMIGIVVGANVVMYGVVRSITMSRKKGPTVLESLGNMFNPSTRQRENPMDELRQKVDELEKGKKDGTGNS